MKTERLNPVQIMTLTSAAILGVDVLLVQTKWFLWLAGMLDCPRFRRSFSCYIRILLYIIWLYCTQVKICLRYLYIY